MVKPIETLVVIPARGGSKSIPRKNIKLLRGVPLIAYSIAAGLNAKKVTRVIVSTDDREIADTALAWGAQVPFIRPEELGQDDTTDFPVFEHALGWLAEHQYYKPDLVIQLRPTSPIRPVDLVDKAIDSLLKHSKADSLRGVVPAGQNPHKMWRLNGENAPMKNLIDVPGIDEPYNALRQTLPPIYWQTGHIDVIRTQTILDGSMSGKNIYPLIIDPKFTVDLDTESDWRRTEYLMENIDLPIVLPKYPPIKS